jgi:putative Ca2+/H+ antiporter (TMEM165/GDT1 family)
VAGSAKARGGLVLDEALATPSAFWTATWRSYLVILCLEIGDRTFFIAALLAGKHPGTTVFVGAFGASSFVLVCARSVLLTPRHSDVYSAQSMQARCL